jgi:hypothetical protein
MFALRRPFRQNEPILYAPRVLLVKAGGTASADKSFTPLRSGQPFDSRVASPREATCDRMRTRRVLIQDGRSPLTPNIVQEWSNRFDELCSWLAPLWPATETATTRTEYSTATAA